LASFDKLPNQENHVMLYFIRIFLGFFFPGGFVLLTAFISLYLNLLPPLLPRIVEILPYIILGVGFILGWRFHRSRLSLIILIIILSERMLSYFGIGGKIASEYEEFIHLSIACLLPINMAFYYLVKERGLFNLRGFVRLFLLLLQPLVIFLLVRFKPDVFLHYLTFEFMPLPWVDFFHVSQPVFFVNVIFIIIFLIGALIRRQPVIRGFFWALLAISLALQADGTGPQATFYFCLAGFIIILSVLEAAYAMAFRDELTGLPARRALNNALQGLGRNYTIAMLDIDFFKKFNDRFGHDVFDQVLCMVASHIKRVGGGGKPFRYGGEEFSILFQGKTRDETIQHLENLRQSIANAQFALRGKNRPKNPPKKPQKRIKQPSTVSVTISIGAASPTSKKTRPSEVLKAADKALYRAKRNGRNCVAS
jgi:diguanylate cyclase (GGDEF)-like protein